MSATDPLALKLAAQSRQVADFFRPYPADEAARGIADHISRFWTRQMRMELVDLARRRPDAIDPLVLRAMALIDGATAGAGR